MKVKTINRESHQCLSASTQFGTGATLSSECECVSRGHQCLSASTQFGTKRDPLDQMPGERSPMPFGIYPVRDLLRNAQTQHDTEQQVTNAFRHLPSSGLAKVTQEVTGRAAECHQCLSASNPVRDTRAQRRRRRASVSSHQCLSASTQFGTSTGCSPSMPTSASPMPFGIYPVRDITTRCMRMPPPRLSPMPFGIYPVRD